MGACCPGWHGLGGSRPESLWPRGLSAWREAQAFGLPEQTPREPLDGQSSGVNTRGCSKFWILLASRHDLRSASHTAAPGSGRGAMRSVRLVWVATHEPREDPLGTVS